MKVTVFKPSADVDLPPDAVLTNTFKVGRFKCTMTIDCGVFDRNQGAPFQAHVTAEWAPSMPRKLNKRALNEYRAGRDILYGMAANVIRGNVRLAEL
jgi:hypothetical protein